MKNILSNLYGKIDEINVCFPSSNRKDLFFFFQRSKVDRISIEEIIGFAERGRTFFGVSMNKNNGKETLSIFMRTTVPIIPQNNWRLKFVPIEGNAREVENGDA